jgi:hypothetical protein
MRTDAEIRVLKDVWQQDPTWDIEDTEGFEEHREALREWRLAFEAELEEREEMLLAQRAQRGRRSVEMQDAMERRVIDERRYRTLALRDFRELMFYVRAPNTDELENLVASIVDNMLQAAVARTETLILERA